MFLSIKITSASMPAAIHAAFQPTFPAPSTTTLAGRTPGAPPINTPRPPLCDSKKCAPICGANRPATSLIGASNGSEASGICTVSYANDVVPAVMRALATSGYAARCKYVNNVRSRRKKPNSSFFGSFTFTTIGCAHASAAVGTIVAPAATKSESEIEAPSPAPVSTHTAMPYRSHSLTPSGVIATRPSAIFTSRGTPIERISVIPIGISH